MKLHKLCFLALAAAWTLGASAQWQWVDKDGRKVFSDRPPPPEVAEKSILRQPHARPQPQPPAAANDTGSASAAAPTKAAAGTPAKGEAKGVDKELEQRKAKADAEKAAQEKAAEQKLAAERTENCNRARRAKASLESGQLMRHTNAKGESVYMDDATRTAERKRADAIIAADCKP